MPDEKTGGAAKLARILRVFEKHQQLIHRHAPSCRRHVLEHFRQHSLNAAQATGQLGLSRGRLYALATAYNPARARKRSRPRPKAKSNANISSGRGASPPTSPVKRLPKSKSSIRRSTPGGRIVTRTKSIGNCARPRNGPRIRPDKKGAPSCGQRPPARGGILLAARARPSK